MSRRFTGKLPALIPMRMLNKLLLLRAVHHIHAKLFEQDVKKNNRNDKEPELVPAGEQAALWFSLFGHSL